MPVRMLPRTLHPGKSRIPAEQRADLLSIVPLQLRVRMFASAASESHPRGAHHDLGSSAKRAFILVLTLCLRRITDQYVLADLGIDGRFDGAAKMLARAGTRPLPQPTFSQLQRSRSQPVHTQRV